MSTDEITVTVTDAELLGFGMRCVAEEPLGMDMGGMTLEEIDSYIADLTCLRDAMRQLDAGADRITGERRFLLQAARELIQSGDERIGDPDLHEVDQDAGRHARDVGVELLRQLGEATTV